MENIIKIREYNSNDKEKIIDLLKLNTPKYFAEEEAKDLIYYMDNEIEYYYVIELNNVIVGSGGINIKENGTIGYISWDLLNPELHWKGLGTLILNYRIEKLKAEKMIESIIVRTTQIVYKFYEKSGFEVIEKVKDYWAKGFDLYKMEYKKK